MNRLSRPGLVLLVLGLVGSAMAATLPKESFTFHCPENLALTNISSVYDSTTEDRTWELGCGDVNVTRDYYCKVLHPANNWNTDVQFQCTYYYQFIGGMTSIYDNDAKDRIFFFMCCSGFGYARNSGWTNDLNEYGGPVNFSTPTGKIVHGVQGRYSSSSRDRIWRFELCDWEHR